MSNLRYIIALRNFEPAPPEYEYYCGTKGTAGKHLFNGATTEDIIWDDDRDAALKLLSEGSAADSYIALTELGYDGMIVYKVAQVYTPIDVEIFKALVAKNRVESILASMSGEDVDYLKKLGILDLTIVT